MALIPTPRSKRETRRFHDQDIDVYPARLPLEKIHFWPENNRTIFTFERLARREGKPLEHISLEVITQFVANQDIHQLEKLASSIKRNGVQVPLILRNDGKLLDGNRRFFACQWIKMKCESAKEAIPAFLKNIPVHVIRKTDLRDPTLELKILAEANFISDLKVAWSHDAQARAVDQYYWSIRRRKHLDHATALEDVHKVFGIERTRASDYLEVLKLTKRFIRGGKGIAEQLGRREIVEERFVYFWEFLNKAMKGRGAIIDSADLDDVQGMFFSLMAKRPDSPLKNIKQVEPLIQAKRIKAAWSLLKESNGAKLPLVISMVNERRDIRKSEDKIRLFLVWLQEASGLTENAKGLLKELSNVATDKSRT